MKKALSFVAAGAIALFSTRPVLADEQGLLLAMTITKGETIAMKPTLWSKIGTRASVSADGALTLDVTSTSAGEGAVVLDIAVSERTTEGSRASRTTVTVPLEKKIRIQLGAEPASSWIIEFTPRVTGSPQKAST